MKNTQWLVASLIAVMVSVLVVGCGGGAGAPPPPDSNTTIGGGDNNTSGGGNDNTGGSQDDNGTTGGGDDNTTTGEGEVHPNTKLTIQKSDLGDCPDMRVQVWFLEYEAGANSKLFGLVEFAEENITDEGNNYSVEIPTDKIPQTNFYHAHATVFCGERIWGMKSLSYDMDDNSGFHKAPFSLVLMFGRTFPEDDDPEYPDEINQGRPLFGLVYGVQSSVPMYADFPTNSQNSVDKTSMIKNGYEVYWWDRENVQLHNEKGYVWDNNSTPRWEYGDDVHGYIDAGTSPALGLATDGYVWFAANISLHNGEASYSDIVFKTKGETYLNFGVENYPSWMPEP